MKRKTNSRESVDANGQPDTKKRALSSEEVALRFRDGLFEPSVQQNYTKAYAQSKPYVQFILTSRLRYIQNANFIQGTCMVSSTP